MIAQPSMASKPSNFSWQVVASVALSWTIILACITFTVYRAEESSAKWHQFQTRMTSVLADLQGLREQTQDLKNTLTDISKLQLLETLAISPTKKNPELLKTLLNILRSSSKVGGDTLNNGAAGQVVQYDQS